MNVWKGIVVVGGYSIQATIYYQKTSLETGDLITWYGSGKASAAHLLKRLSKNLNQNIETNIGTICVTQLLHDGTVEFQGTGKPRRALARDIYPAQS